MPTAQQVKEQLKASGYQGEPTPEILRQWGWTPADPLAGVPDAVPVKSRQELKDDLALLKEEAEAANVPAVIIDKILGLGARALTLGR